MPQPAQTTDYDTLRAMLERATISAWLIDADETILFTNDAAADLTGYPLDELIGKPMSMLMVPALGAAHEEWLRSYIGRGGDSSVLGQAREFEIVHKDGRKIPVEIRAFELPETPDGKIRFGAFISDNTAHKQFEAEMLRAARRDYLTGCLNRLGFMERAAEELSRARRNGRPLSLIVMDLDRFKRVNDTHGHQGGDQILANLRAALSESLRAHDVFGRVGGEEFFILLPETDIADARIVAKRIRKSLEQHTFICNGATVAVTASLGCASLGADDDMDRLIRAADRRMYLAKNAGRNQVVAVDVAPVMKNFEPRAKQTRDRSESP